MMIIILPYDDFDSYCGMHVPLFWKKVNVGNINNDGFHPLWIYWSNMNGMVFELFQKQLLACLTETPAGTSLTDFLCSRRRGVC